MKNFKNLKLKEKKNMCQWLKLTTYFLNINRSAFYMAYLRWMNGSKYTLGWTTEGTVLNSTLNGKPFVCRLRNGALRRKTVQKWLQLSVTYMTWNQVKYIFFILLFLLWECCTDKSKCIWTPHWSLLYNKLCDLLI